MIDTNVLLDLWVFADPRARLLRTALEGGEFAAVRSLRCDEELADVLARAELKVAESARQEILSLWHRLAMPAEPRAAPLTCSDPDDQKFLDLAWSAGAGWLFTRDKALLALAGRARTEGLRIAQPDLVASAAR